MRKLFLLCLTIALFVGVGSADVAKSYPTRYGWIFLPGIVTPQIVIQNGWLYDSTKGDSRLVSKRYVDSLAALPAEQLVLEARCVEPGGIQKGRPVTVTGATGFRADVKYTDIYDTLLNDFLGVANETKLFGQQIQVLIRGRCSDIKTDYLGWQEGDRLYLCDTGCLTNVRPDSGSVVHVGYVLRVHLNQGEIEIAPFNERNLSVARGRGLFVRLGDSTGATDWQVRDWQNNTVAWIGSDGRAAIGTGEKPAYDSLVGLRVFGNPCFGDTSNRVIGGWSTISGGVSNIASGGYATVGGGSINTASGNVATVGGGDVNTASGAGATVGGGYTNTASSYVATVGGGYTNIASSEYATVGGGYTNTASGYVATIGGGYTNTASGDYATIPGGYSLFVSGNYSRAGGQGPMTVEANNHDAWKGTASVDTSGPRPGAALTTKGMANCDSFTGDGSLLTGVLADSCKGGATRATLAANSALLQGKDTTALKAVFGTKAADDLATAKADSALGSPAFSAYLTTTQTCTTGTATRLRLGSELYDTHSAFNTTTFKYYVPAGWGGIYDFKAHVRWTAAVDVKQINLSINVNGTAVVQNISITSGTGIQGDQIVADMVCAAGDSVDVIATQATAASQTIQSGSQNSFFTGHWVRRAP